MDITNQRYGVAFPFRDSPSGYFLRTTNNPREEIKSNLIHLLLTRKGSRYFLPDFGTRLYQFIFEPIDATTFKAIDAEIKQAVDTYIPNIKINEIKIEPLDLSQPTDQNDVSATELNGSIYRVAGDGTEEHTAKISIDFTVKDDVFGNRDFVIINL
jgi:phage baseplate assembly protein W